MFCILWTKGSYRLRSILYTVAYELKANNG